MDEYVLLGIAVGSIAVSTALIIYIRMLKKRLRRHVLRYDQIKKYFEGE